MLPDYNTGEVPYVNQANYTQKRPEPRGESPIGESMTVPGDALSLKEILKRAQGGITAEERNYGYFDQPDLEKVNRFFAPHTLDLTDIDELKRKTEKLKAAVDQAIAKRDADPEADPPIPEDPAPEPTPEPPAT